MDSLERGHLESTNISNACCSAMLAFWKIMRASSTVYTSIHEQHSEHYLPKGLIDGQSRTRANKYKEYLKA